ncbi:uncharacterized protein LOC127799801 [Diospyros lotus]|uniref:uncharacterized protein LOC127799801 n=1 Tax=Diospyros lotus TaxID=55363 RepID=UPI002252F7ED|nr:uncharacterized protein LOC127799801 [Diospyros lotus]
METLIASLLSGFGQVLDKLLGSPLDFLTGKSCSTSCGSTWDFLCYIEHFCVAHLFKMAMVSILFYFVLLFFYSLFKLGICQCVGRSLCKLVWAAFASCFSLVECSCRFLCYKLPRLKRKHRRPRRDIEEFDICSSSSDGRGEEEDGSVSCDRVPRETDYSRSMSRRWKDYRGDHLRRSLRPRSHRVRVGARGGSVHAKKREVNEIRVVRTPKFAQKTSSQRRLRHKKRRK